MHVAFARAVVALLEHVEHQGVVVVANLLGHLAALRAGDVDALALVDLQLHEQGDGCGHAVDHAYGRLGHRPLAALLLREHGVGGSLFGGASVVFDFLGQEKFFERTQHEALAAARGAHLPRLSADPAPLSVAVLHAHVLPQKGEDGHRECEGLMHGHGVHAREQRGAEGVEPFGQSVELLQGLERTVSGQQTHGCGRCADVCSGWGLGTGGDVGHRGFGLWTGSVFGCDFCGGFAGQVFDAGPHGLAGFESNSFHN